MVLYFTGTGNSRFAARIIAQSLGEQAVSLNDAIKSGEKTDIACETLVIVTPTYAWQIPHLVRDRLLNEDIIAKRAYFVMTCGDDIGSADTHCARLCRKKGIEYMGVYPVVMPENYVAMFNVPKPETAQKIIDAALPDIQKACDFISQNKPFPKAKVTVTDKLKSGIVNTAFYKLCVSAKGFYATADCIACGKCARLCPFGNITLEASHPIWGTKCTHCMACICACPEQAVEYKNISQGKPRHYID